MDIFSAKIRVASVLAGLAITVLASLIIMAVVRFVFGLTVGIAFLAVIMIIMLFMDIVQWLVSPYVIGWTYHMKPLSEAGFDASWIQDSVEKIAMLNSQPVPKVFIADAPFPNAFAYGSPLTGRRMAITRGLLTALNREEIEAVIGHEIGHLKHHDAELLLAIGLIPMIIFYLGYTMIFTGGGRGRQNGSFLLVALVLIAVSFLFNIMILGVNRMRESYADINAATTVPHGAENLQSALAKIASNTPTGLIHRRRRSTSSASNMLMIYNPEQPVYGDHRDIIEKWKHMKVPILSSIFSDHPHPAKRIQILENYKNI